MVGKPYLIYALFFGSFTLSSCSSRAQSDPNSLSTAATQGPYPDLLSKQTMDIGPTSRDYLVYVPPGLRVPKALVFVLHGGGGEGLNVAQLGRHPLAVFRSVADREGFVVVYPSGLLTPDAGGKAGWVDCRADNKLAGEVDDISFLASLVQRVRAQYGLESAQIFMAGGSNGAQMAQAFAFHHAELLGAVAVASGSLPAAPRPGPCTAGPSRSLPILITHGSADTVMPWSGGCVANFGGSCNRGRVVSAEATRDRWLQINGLTGVTPVQSEIERNGTDGGPAQRWDYAGAAPLQWWRLEGAGHPIASITVRERISPAAGKQNGDVEFAEIAWSFFALRLEAL